MVSKEVDYHFTNDWFGAWENIWSHLFSQLHPSKYLEIGCYEGRSTCFFIEEAAKFSAQLSLSCIDSWNESMQVDSEGKIKLGTKKIFDSNLEKAIAFVKCPVQKNIYSDRSINVLPSLYSIVGKDYYDLIYIDASHLAKHVLSDAVMSFPLLRPGGVMIFDDYLSSAKIGIDSFVNIYFDDLTLIPNINNGAVFIQKK